MQNSVKYSIGFLSLVVAIVLINSMHITKTGAWSGWANMLFYYPMYAVLLYFIWLAINYVSINFYEYLFPNHDEAENNQHEKLPSYRLDEDDSFLNGVLKFFVVIFGAVALIVVLSKI